MCCRWGLIPAACWPALRRNSWAGGTGTSDCRSIYGLVISGQSSSAMPSCIKLVLISGKLDVISGYSTDLEGLKPMTWPYWRMIKRYFLPIMRAPVVRRTEVLQRYPELAPVLNLLSGKINDSYHDGTELQGRLPKGISRAMRPGIPGSTGPV